VFVHLHVHSPFSFLDGAARLEDLVTAAAGMNMPALAITDHNNVSAVTNFHKLATEAGIKPVQGTELTVSNHHLILLAKNRKGYASICRLLTEAHLSAPSRHHPDLDRRKLACYSGDIIALSGCRRGDIPAAILARDYDKAEKLARYYRHVFGKENFYIELQNDFLPRCHNLNRHLVELAGKLDLDIVATNNVHYLHPRDFPIHDILTCVRTNTTLEDVHPERHLNSCNYLRSPQEMHTLFARYPRAYENTTIIASRCKPVLEPGRNYFPFFPGGENHDSGRLLTKLVYAGARKRYGRLTERIRNRLQHELDIILRLGVEDYFLVVWDVVRFARHKGIRYAGRGSAADSAVAYCLGITEVDSIERGLLFERFLSLERAQKPDIDLDFDARYRDDIASYIYEKYGQDKVASVCTFNTFQARSAIRDLGKAMGLPDDELGKLAKTFPHIPADALSPALKQFPEIYRSNLPFHRYKTLFSLCERVAGFPRFIGTHLGGIVISRVPIFEISPLQKAAKGMLIIQMDKTQIEDLGLIKIDLLSLRTLSAIQDAVTGIQASGNRFDYEQIPLDDKQTYEMLSKGETVGVFQLESPAQRALQTRLGAGNIEDIVASVALIRPGPIKGNMVEPFLKHRKNQEQDIKYIHPELESILSKTYGVVLFQEQVIEIATVIAGFTPGEADKLRKVMTHYRSHAEMQKLGKHFIAKAINNGVSREVAETVFSYIAGYAGYGFCEAHAAAFATTAYKTAYLIKHYPAHFYAAILSNEPMGFYPPSTICLQAKRRGIKILGPDINRSEKQFTVEGGGIRISLQQVKGMKERTVNQIISERKTNGNFMSLQDVFSRVDLDRDIAENLVLAGTFDRFNSNRKQMLWQIHDIMYNRRCNQMLFSEPAADYAIPDFPPLERFLHSYAVLGLSADTHLMTYCRPRLEEQGVITSEQLQNMPSGKPVKVAGIVIRPHRPPTKSGKTVVFLTLEDEFGLIDVTVFESVYRSYGKELFTQPCLLIKGKVQRRGQGISVIAFDIEPLSI